MNYHVKYTTVGRRGGGRTQHIIFCTGKDEANRALYRLYHRKLEGEALGDNERLCGQVYRVLVNRIHKWHIETVGA